MKKVLTYLLSMTLVAALTIDGTLAYLTSEDSAVNVMTLGDEKKLVCLNTGYVTYWDASTQTFKLQAK